MSAEYGRALASTNEALIWPLFLVAVEQRNDLGLRSLAVRHLRYINASLGIREAGLLVDTAALSL